MKKLIYLSSIRLTDSVLRDYYVDVAIKKCAEVEVWDLVPLYRDDYEEKGALDVDYLRYVKTFKEFKVLINMPENRDAVYVVVVTYLFEYVELFKLLSENKSKMVYTYGGAMPLTKVVSKLQRIIDHVKNGPINFFKIVFSLILFKLYRKFNLVKPFEIGFVVGESPLPFNFFAKKTVPINSFEYDSFQKSKLSNESFVDGRYILFVDHNAPYHSDNIRTGKPFPDEEIYFKSINRIIGLIEASQNLKVVIAASPKSKYGSEKYEGREFYRLMTAELTKKAELIIMPYASNSISLAVLNYKPILFIYNDELMKVWPSSVIEQQNIAAYLNLEVYNADLITHGNQLVIKQPIQERYDLYKYNYLTSRESENKTSSEIFFEKISML